MSDQNLMKHLINKNLISEFVKHVVETLENKNFEVFLVGGCVRDLILGREVKDWDLTTNAKPEEIIESFPKTVYENKFGTVLVINEVPPPNPPLVKGEEKQKTEKISFAHNLETRTYKLEPSSVEITPYRIEGKYTDNRHPDEVKFSENIEDDLKMRYFTVNAIAYSISSDKLIDLYDGQDDLKNKTIKAVGDAKERFNEDALRMMRAIRFSTQLGFVIESTTMTAIAEDAYLLKNISEERIRDEFVKIIESNNPAQGIGMLQKLGLLKYFIPELEDGIGCHQGGAHKYDVFEHLLGALEHAANKGFSTEIRLSALFHDIGKPATKRVPPPNLPLVKGEEKEIKGSVDSKKISGPRVGSPDAEIILESTEPDAKNLQPDKKPTFYGHEVVGARIAKKIMERLKFPKDTIEFVTNMVRRHMFFSDTEQITLSAVRRVIQNVGPEHIWELMQIRECDRVGMEKKEAPYRLRKYHAIIEQCLRDPISVSQLVVDGNILMNDLSIKAGPRMGYILNALLEEVLEDPEKNTREYLDKKVAELNTLSDTDLKSLGEKAKTTKDELESQEITKLNKKHGVS